MILEGFEPSEYQRISVYRTGEKKHIPTNEAPHCDSRTGLAVETVEGTSLAQMLYDALLQSVQVMLAGSEVGGVSEIF